MAAVIPLKIVSGTISRLGTTDEIYAQGIYPRTGTVLALGDPTSGVTGTTVVNIGGIETSDVNIGVGYVGAAQNINIGTDATGGTITLGNAGTLVQIDGALTVVSTSTFEGNTIIGDSLADTLSVVASVINNLTFQKGFDHSILVDAATAGAGNAISIVGGAGFTTNAGGAANITGGAAPGVGAGGQVTLTGGASATGVPGGISVVSARTPAAQGAALSITQNGVETGILVGSVDPNGGGGVVAPRGSTYHQDDGGAIGALWVKTGTAATDWVEVASVTGQTLQSAYNAGNTIAVDAANGSITFSDTDATDVLTINRTFAGGEALAISMGAGTSGRGIEVNTTDVGASGASVFINNLGTGNALQVQDDTVDVFVISSAGAFTVIARNNGAVGSAVSLTAGAGVTGVGGAASLVAGAGGSAGAGGAVNITSGVSTTASDGGNVLVTAGNNSFAGGGKGGSIELQAGHKTDIAGAANAGSVTINAGSNSGTDDAGAVDLSGGAADSGFGGRATLSGGPSTSGIGGLASVAAGASISSTGGAAAVTGGNSNTGTGGTLSLSAGDGAASGGVGGNATFRGGDVGAGAGNAGSATVRGGNAFATTGLGGAVAITGGSSPGSVAGGQVTITGGTSGTGQPGGSTITTSRGATNGALASKGPALTLAQTGSAGASVDTFAGTANPSGGTGVAANVGSVYLRNVDGVDTTGQLWIKIGAADTAWEVVTTLTGQTLQAAYDAGNTIAVTTGNGTIDFSNSADTTDVLTLSRTFAGIGEALAISMGATTSGRGIEVSSAAGATGASVFINNLGTGNALQVQDDTVDVFAISGAGAITAAPTSGQNFTVDAAGAGVISLDAAAASNFSVTGGNLTLSTITTGNVILGTAGATDDITFQARGNATPIPFSAAAPDNALVGFVATSVIGALNELMVGTTSATQLVIPGLTTTGLADGDFGYISAAMVVTKTDAEAAVSSVSIGANEGTVSKMTVQGVIENAKFTTAGGSPGNGAPVWLAKGSVDGATGAGKLTAVAPSASGDTVAEMGICIDNSNYAALKTCKVLLQAKGTVFIT